MKTRITVNLTFLAAIFCWMISSSVAVAADVSNRVTVTRTGFVLNRATDTFDSVITIRNSGPNALVGPMKFISKQPGNCICFWGRGFGMLGG